jgi:hypothetical protein
MFQETEPSACVGGEVRGSSPASSLGRSNARIGREVFVRASGTRVSEVLDHSMAFARSPNKALEPTTMAVTPRAMPLCNSYARPGAARGAPAMVVAHL